MAISRRLHGLPFGGFENGFSSRNLCPLFRDVRCICSLVTCVVAFAWPLCCLSSRRRRLRGPRHQQAPSRGVRPRTFRATPASGLMFPSQPATVGIRPKSSITCCSPTKRTGTSRPVLVVVALNHSEVAIGEPAQAEGIPLGFCCNNFPLFHPEFGVVGCERLSGNEEQCRHWCRHALHQHLDPVFFLLPNERHRSMARATQRTVSPDRIG